MEQQKKSQGPRLMDHSYLEQGGTRNSKQKMYMYILLVVFVVVSYFWKGFVNSEPSGQEAQSLAPTPSVQTQTIPQ